MGDLKALFILPHYDFDDDEYFKLRDYLESSDVLTEVCSTHLSEAQGRFKKLIKPDFLVDDVRSNDFDAFIFIGGLGSEEFYHSTCVHELVKDILVSHKVLALLDDAVPILYYANVVNGRKVTTLETLKHQIEAGGGYYTGKTVEQDGDIITGFDNRSTKEVADAVIRALDWQKKSSEVSKQQT